MIRVLLVEDHAAFRKALALTLRSEADMEVVGQAGTVAEARDRLWQAPVDVAVVDFALPDGTGVGVIKDLHVAWPGAEALVLTGSADRRDLANVIQAGAAGALRKSAALSEILEGIRRLCRGEPLVPPHELVGLWREGAQERERERVTSEASARLTPREREVLQALAGVLADQEIADRLHISRETVRTHMVNTLGKLEVDPRLQAVILAVKYGIVVLGGTLPEPKPDEQRGEPTRIARRGQ